MPPLERTTPAGRAARLRGTFFLGALLAALVPAAVDCGGGDDDDGPGADFNCADAYGSRCGMGCINDAACGAGMFCGGGTCTAQCSGDAGCASGQSCSTQGRCVGGTAGSGSGGSGGGLPPINMSGSGGGGPVAGAGGSDGNCPDVSVQFRPIIPAIMLVVDRSASMRCPITSDAELVNECGNPPNADNPNSRWQTFKGPLLSFINEQKEKAIFGITFYPEGTACGVETESTVTLKTGDNAFTEISAAYNAEAPNGQTPTGAALDSAVAQMNAVADLPDGTPKFMILASDGSPFCGAGTETAQQNAAVTAAGDAFDAGIRTFVIAIGELFSANAAKEAQFQAIADAGAGLGKPDGVTDKGPLYPVTNTAALTAALNTIINGVRPCSFDLDKALTNPAADGPKGKVTIDDQPIDFNSPNGWQLTDNDTITFVGTACDSIRSGSTNVKAEFPCGVETTPVPPPPPPPR